MDLYRIYLILIQLLMFIRACLIDYIQYHIASTWSKKAFTPGYDASDDTLLRPLRMRST